MKVCCWLNLPLLRSWLSTRPAGRLSSAWRLPNRGCPRHAVTVLPHECHSHRPTLGLSNAGLCRSRVWAEPCLIEAAKKEYDGVIEEFLAVGEKLFGPYVWGR